MNRACLILLVGVGFCGCSPSAYVRDADRQVQAIVREREQKVLGYQPQVDPGDVERPLPSKKAYDPIPLSLMPPPQPSPMERQPIVEPQGPLGPELRWMELPPVEMDTFPYDVSEARPGRGPTLGPAVPRLNVPQFGLFESIAYAVENSRSYRDQMDDLYRSALDVTLQRHLFEPRPFASLRYDFEGGQGDINYRSALTATGAAGVRQRLPLGGEIVAQGLTSFVNALSDNLSDGESASIAISGSIPLLRGAGLVNLEPLIQSERNVVYQVRAFESFRRSFVVDISGRYFRLLTLQQSVNNRRRNLANLTAFTEQMQELWNAGRLPNRLQVQQALQAKLTAQGALIDAMDAYNTALDEFKIALGMPVEQPLDIVPVVLDVEVPKVQDEEALALARRFRLELQTVRDRVEDARRQVQVARNGLLPDLDIDARAEVGNRDGTTVGAFDARTATYGAGVTLDLPVDRVIERNRYRASLIDLAETQRRYEQSLAVVEADVRDSIRAIRSAQESLQIQRRGIELAETRLDFATELLRIGRPGVNARDAIEAQSALLDAQDRYDRAKGQLQIRVLEYLRDTGLLRVDPKAGALGLAMDRGVRRSTE